MSETREAVQLDRIRNAREAAFSALRAMGVEVPDDANVDDIAQLILMISGSVDMAEWVHKAVGTTYPPAQLPAAPAFEGYDIDILNSAANDVYAYIDAVVSGKDTVTKEIIGKDASGKYDIARYTFANRERIAWVREKYPRMYAWKDNSEGRVEPNFTNLKDQCTWTYGQRYSLSGGTFKALSNCATVVVPVPSGQTSVKIRFKGLAQQVNGFTGVYGGTSATKFTEECTPAEYVDGTGWPDHPDSDGVYTFTCPKSAGTTYILIHSAYDGSSGAAYFADSIITVNEPIEYITVGGDVLYSASVSPRIGDTLYTTPYIGAAKGAVTAVSATNRSRTVGGLEYVRFADGDVEPTVIYTDKSDSRNSNASITQDGATYNRYPLGDLGANAQKLIPIVIYANEHGISPAKIAEGTYETKMCALVAARFFRDLCAGTSAGTPLYKYIRESGMVIVVPVANPFGFNLNVSGDKPAYAWTADGYLNYNGVNINRNYDCPGWDVMDAAGTEGATMGSYPGSEVETQYIMNTMVESGADVAMSLHGLGDWEGYCAYQGQQPDGSAYNQDKLTKVAALLLDNYGYILRNYDSSPSQNTPDITSKSPSYITQCGAYGGIVEFSPDDVRTSGWKQEMNAFVIENAYAQMLNLMAMWLSDYLEG